MQIISYQTAFAEDGQPTRIRVITIPDEQAKGASEMALLELAFHYGQNDFQPSRTCYSMSVGDVVQLPDESLHWVAPCGFMPVPAGTAPDDLPRGRAAREAVSDAFYDAA